MVGWLIFIIAFALSPGLLLVMVLLLMDKGSDNKMNSPEHAEGEILSERTLEDDEKI